MLGDDGKLLNDELCDLVLKVQHYDNQFKKGEMGGACSTRGE